MTPLKLTRRSFTMALAGTALAPTLGLTSELATITVGDRTVSLLSDGHIDVPPTFFSGADPRALSAAGAPVRLGATVWLIRDGARALMVDTGSGEALTDMFPTVGQLDALLSAEEISKSDITDIVLTHMHPDHIGGLMGPGAGGFVNARIHVAEAEWAFWTNPDLPAQTSETDRPIVSLIQTIAAPLADRVVLHPGERDLGSGISVIPLPGHTPGHSGVRLSAPGSQDLILAGDAIISQALQFDNPAVSYALDADPANAVATRTSLLNQLADSGAALSATHLPYPGTGRVSRKGSGFAFEPLV